MVFFTMPHNSSVVSFERAALAMTLKCCSVSLGLPFGQSSDQEPLFILFVKNRKKRLGAAIWATGQNNGMFLANVLTASRTFHGLGQIFETNHALIPSLLLVSF